MAVNREKFSNLLPTAKPLRHPVLRLISEIASRCSHGRMDIQSRREADGPSHPRLRRRDGHIYLPSSNGVSQLHSRYDTSNLVCTEDHLNKYIPATAASHNPFRSLPEDPVPPVEAFSLDCCHSNATLLGTQRSSLDLNLKWDLGLSDQDPRRHSVPQRSPPTPGIPQQPPKACRSNQTVDQTRRESTRKASKRYRKTMKGKMDELLEQLRIKIEENVELERRVAVLVREIEILREYR